VTAGSRSYASEHEGNEDEEEEQGPRVFIVENGGGEQHTGVEIRLDMLRSLRERQRGEIKERRGGWVRSTRQACGGRDTKRRKEREGEMRGVWYGDNGAGQRADRMLGKGEAHSAQKWRALHDAAATRKQGAIGPDTGGVCRARSEMTQHA